MKSEEILNAFKQLTSFRSDDERIEYDAQELAFSFLSAIDKEMAAKKISKKNLADSIGTSASYITQLFRGDRMPNFTNLAKMKNALELEFEIKVKAPAQNTTEVQFPDVKIEKGRWWVCRSTEPNYQKSLGQINEVQFNETEAA